LDTLLTNIHYKLQLIYKIVRELHSKAGMPSSAKPLAFHIIPHLYLPLNMLHQEFAPPEELTGVIKCFWHNTQEAQVPGSSFEVVPDGYAEIIFHFGTDLSSSRNGNLQPLPSPFMIGLLNQPVIFNTKNRLEIIGVRCFPWTVFDLLGLSPDKDGVRIIEHPIAQLQSRLAAYIIGGQIEEAIDALKQYFLDVQSLVTTDAVLFKAGKAMRDANGAMSVSQVAEASHATVRTLERKFKSAAGYSVKDVSGLIRFEQVRNQLWQNPGANLAGLAHELGYTDQAHLTREFKRYTGTTPAAFARKAEKDKRELGTDFIAFIQ
jgi:AraC-like DNA-binding protein